MARPPSSTSDILLYFLAIFISPASVFIKRGCHADFWINLALFILGWIPGVIHAWWIISRYEAPAHSVTAAHPASDQYQPVQQPVGNYQQAPPPNYGTVKR